MRVQTYTDTAAAETHMCVTAGIPETYRCETEAPTWPLSRRRTEDVSEQLL